MFSLANALLLRLLPVEDPSSLVLFSRTNARDNLGASFSYPFCRVLQHTGTVTLAAVTCRAGMGPPVVEIDGPAEIVSGELVSGNFFDLLGVRPHLGRLFSPADNVTPGGHPLVVLSHGYWQRRFGGDPSVIGRTIRINSQPMTILGVTPPGFAGIELGFSPDIRLPIVMGTSETRSNSPEEWWLQIIGRLGPNVDRGAATAELDTRLQASYATLPAEFIRHHLTLLPAGQGIRRLQERFQIPLLVLNVLSGIILLIVCLNVANLMIARAAARAREFSLRRALGARTSRIVVQLVVESGLIVAAGGVLSLVLAAWLIPVVAVAAVPASTVALLGVGIDVRVLAFAAALCGVVTLAAGLAPALVLRRPSIDSAMTGRHTARGAATGRRVFVAAQIALSFVMLVAAGLFARTLTGLQMLDLGFNPQNLVPVGLAPPKERGSPSASGSTQRSRLGSAACPASRHPVSQ